MGSNDTEIVNSKQFRSTHLKRHSMKKFITLKIFAGLFLSLFLPNIAFSQGGIGLTNGDAYVPVRVNSGNGFDTGGKGGSALEQLENMTGTKISTSNTNTRTVAPAAVKTISSAAAFQHEMNMMVASSVASAFINFIFSDNSKSNQQAAEAQRQQAILLAQRAAEEKRIADLIAQEKYDQMMKSYKLLNDPNGLQIKTLSTGNLQFKSLDQSTPLTMDERQLQILRKKGISLTWDYNSWANISHNSNMIEETYNQEESGEYKKLDDIIDKHKSEDGGREAEAVGIFMKHRIISTMSYLKDVSDAVGRNDWARLGELGNRDEAKMLSNDLNASVGEFKDKLIAEGKGKVIGYIEGAKDAMIKDGVKDMATKYVPKETLGTWKVINNSYYKD